MSYPFRIGEVYGNRLGTYRVESIDGSTLRGRYSDGKPLTGDVATLGRIWENMQAEVTMDQPSGDGKEAPRSLRPRNGKQGTMFEGLVEHDFQDGVTGTTWRGRQSLGGLLAKRLSERLGATFESWAIYRRADVYLTREGCYTNNRELGTHHAKFAFLLDPKGASFGFYVERKEDEIDDTWDWLRFIAALRRQTGELKQVQAAMYRHEVTARPKLWGKDPKPTEPGKLIAEKDGLTWCPTGTGAPVSTSWAQFGERLTELEPDKWCDLYFFADMSKAEAIAAGVNIVDRVVDTYVGLLPLYTASLR